MQRLWLAIFIFLLPVSLEAGRVDDLEAEVRSLRTQLELAQRREDEYKKQVEELGKKVEDLSLAVSKNKADYQVELDELKRRVNELSNSILSTKQAIDKVDQKLDRLLGEPAAGAPQGESPPAIEDMPVPAGDIDAQGASAPRSNLDYKQLYQAAVDQVQRKNYGAARSQFEAFLKAYPGTDLSDNAQFWIGECYFAQGHYQRAVLEYDTVRKKYPAGNKVPAALWKMSLAFDKLGNRDVARSFLKELLEKYPDSPEAGLAQEKLNAWR